MEYKSRRERRRVHGEAEKPRGPHGAVIIVAVPKKKRAGGQVEGHAARKHLGRRARGGRTMDARAAAQHEDGVDKIAQGSGTDGRDVPMGGPRKRGGRAQGGQTTRQRETPLDWTGRLQRDHGGDQDTDPRMELREMGAPSEPQHASRGGHTDLHGHPVTHHAGHEETHRRREAKGGHVDKWIGPVADKMARKGTAGALHRQLGVPSGERIPDAKLTVAKARADRTGNVKLARRVQFAENVRK